MMKNVHLPPLGLLLEKVARDPKSGVSEALSCIQLCYYVLSFEFASQ